MNNVLYEIALSIGNSLVLEEVLQKSLTSLLHKLNAIGVAVIKQDKSVLYSIPKRNFSYVNTDILQLICGRGNFEHLLQHYYDEGNHYYYFGLNQTGALLLIRKEELDNATIKMLQGILNKLDNSIQACYSNNLLLEKEKELATSLLELERAQEYKDRFLANMSHEIRTPLNGIIGFVDQLYTTPLNAQQKSYIEIIKQSSHTLMGIINDILDFSKIESGKLEIDLTPINLKTTLESTAELFKCRASEKDILLTCSYAPEVNQNVLADEIRIKQILNNLLSNAIKFTESNGKISADISTISEDDNFLEVLFSIEDNGIGIDKNKGDIFNPFSQADKSVFRKYGGTGLGLPISKQLVKLMGGELAFDSTPHQGSRFYFS